MGCALIKDLRPLQNRRSGFSAESRTLQFAGEMRWSADRRYDEREFFRDLDLSGFYETQGQ